MISIVAIVLLVALLIMLGIPALQSDNHRDAEQGLFSASLSRLARIVTGAGRCSRNSAMSAHKRPAGAI